MTNTPSIWGVRLGTLALWALAGASVVFWGLKLSSRPAFAPVPAVASAPLVPDAQALARLLGVPDASSVQRPAAAPAAPSRFALQGVLAGRQSGGGAAVIVVDNLPPKAFRVGAAVADGLVLQAVGPRQARLGPSVQGPATVTLEIPLTSSPS